LPGPRLIGFRPRACLEGIAMETFTQLFGDLLAFVYHCFDRIVAKIGANRHLISVESGR
jgi:hypothetical protein